MQYMLRMNERVNQDAIDITIVRYNETGTELLDPETGWTEIVPMAQTRPSFTVMAPGYVDKFVVQRYGWIDKDFQL